VRFVKPSDFLDHERAPELDSRPSWDHVWADVVRNIARRSSDPNFKVAAIVVTDDNTQLLSLGYNGDHTGGPNCRESDTPGDSGFIHAEVNSLIKLDFNSPKRKKMYVSLSPCRMCAKAIINARIDEVIYIDEYRDRSGLELLRDMGVKVRQLQRVKHT
jgi:dCMP deaminase